MVRYNRCFYKQFYYSIHVKTAVFTISERFWYPLVMWFSSTPFLWFWFKMLMEEESTTYIPFTTNSNSLNYLLAKKTHSKHTPQKTRQKSQKFILSTESISVTKSQLSDVQISFSYSQWSSS